MIANLIVRIEARGREVLLWSAQTCLRLGKAATRRRTPNLNRAYTMQNERYCLFHPGLIQQPVSGSPLC